MKIVIIVFGLISSSILFAQTEPSSVAKKIREIQMEDKNKACTSLNELIERLKVRYAKEFKKSLKSNTPVEDIMILTHIENSLCKRLID